MQSPAQYVSGNQLQRRDASRLLPPLLARLDCYGTVLGVDTSQAMVDFARRTYGTDRIQFQRADISSPTVAKVIGTTFDRIFSLFCLHWVQDQRLALKNIRDLLNTDGHAILIFLANNKIYEMYEKMSEYPRWQVFMRDWRSFVSPYQQEANPAQRFCHLAAKAGLSACRVTAPWCSFEFSTTEDLEAALTPVNPFVDRIPKEERHTFMAQCVQESTRRLF
ncbi:juvenile hormone acid O-methyltransferase-like [Pollicipes pollicipes]|uniref:juvenile hormone acid O-methyltransferase-like n=1 Tax=Pollicipes pollicipes TaxID=41117 RepID=UPI001884E625|nr:juvenile hormone acid O-methyltransferase-like [Pollicipes pollicipes]